MDLRCAVRSLVALLALCVLATSQQCYNLTCTGSRCLEHEVRTNPLLIPKCERIFYSGCFGASAFLNSETMMESIQACLDKPDTTMTDAQRTCLEKDFNTITTTAGGFITTTTGCIDRGFECTQDSCSGVTVKTEVTCCNSDLCNDGIPASSAARVAASFGVMCMISAFVQHFRQ